MSLRPKFSGRYAGHKLLNDVLCKSFERISKSESLKEKLPRFYSCIELD